MDFEKIKIIAPMHQIYLPSSVLDRVADPLLNDCNKLTYIYLLT